MNILQLCSPELLARMQWSREAVDSLTQMQMDCGTTGTTERTGELIWRMGIRKALE